MIDLLNFKLPHVCDAPKNIINSIIFSLLPCRALKSHFISFLFRRYCKANSLNVRKISGNVIFLTKCKIIRDPKCYNIHYVLFKIKKLLYTIIQVPITQSLVWYRMVTPKHIYESVVSGWGKNYLDFLKFPNYVM